MTVAAGTKPHPIFLAGRWVESPDVLVVDNPADPSTPAGTTYTATEEQYEEAVRAAVAAFEVTRVLPAYERVLGAEHPETLAARSSLASWTGEAGDPVGARD